jgi:hypothetical protein
MSLQIQNNTAKPVSAEVNTTAEVTSLEKDKISTPADLRAAAQKENAPQSTAPSKAAEPVLTPEQLNTRATALYKAFYDRWLPGTDNEKAFKALEGLTPKQGEQLESFYNKRYNRSLETDLRSEMGGTPRDFERAMAGLRGFDADRIAKAAYGAINGIGGDDEARLLQALKDLTPEQQKAVKEAYSKHTNGKQQLADDISSDLTGKDKMAALKAIGEDTPQAHAKEMKNQMQAVLMDNPDYVVETLAGMDPKKRAETAAAYKTEAGITLLDEMYNDNTFGGGERYSKVVELLDDTPEVRAAATLYRAMKGNGTNNAAVDAVLSAHKGDAAFNQKMEQAFDQYFAKPWGSSLRSALAQELSVTLTNQALDNLGTATDSTPAPEPKVEPEPRNDILNKYSHAPGSAPEPTATIKPVNRDLELAKAFFASKQTESDINSLKETIAKMKPEERASFEKYVASISQANTPERIEMLNKLRGTLDMKPVEVNSQLAKNFVQGKQTPADIAQLKETIGKMTYAEGKKFADYVKDIKSENKTAQQLEKLNVLRGVVDLEPIAIDKKPVVAPTPQTEIKYSEATRYKYSVPSGPNSSLEQNALIRIKQDGDTKSLQVYCGKDLTGADKDQWKNAADLDSPRLSLAVIKKDGSVVDASGKEIKEFKTSGGGVLYSSGIKDLVKPSQKDTLAPLGLEKRDDNYLRHNGRNAVFIRE